MANEIGRGLKANELKVGTVVVLGREDRPNARDTVWVDGIGQEGVCFYSGISRMGFVAFLREDGELVDDTGKRIIVNEYLGEV